MISYIPYLFLFGLTLVESFKYVGFTEKHIGFSIYIVFFLLYGIRLTLKALLQKKGDRDLLVQKCVSLVVAAYLILGFTGYWIDVFVYRNFSYSRLLHLEPQTVITLGILLALMIYLDFFADKNTLWRNILYFAYAATGYIFYANWLSTAVSADHMNPFDEALRLLAQNYSTLGFRPYIDFGILYSPGPFIFLGKLIPYTTIFAKNLISSVFSLMLLALCFLVVKRVVKDRERLVISIPFALLLSSLTLMLSKSDPHYIYLLLLLTAVQIAYLRGSRNFILKLTLFLLPVFILFIRWETIFLYILGNGVVLGIIWIMNRKKAEINYSVVSVPALGFLVGLFALAAYLHTNQALVQGFDFIVTIPTRVILAYRTLPLIGFDSIFTSQFSVYACFFVLIMVWLSFLRQLKEGGTFSEKMTAGILFILPAIMVPYAIGRADWSHALMLIFLCGISVLLGYCLNKKTDVKTWVAFFILLIPVLTALTPPPYIFPQGNMEAVYLKDDLAQCRKLLDDKKIRYQSIFVGKKTYERYVIGYTVLYFIDPKAKPATPYITDEPGLQNSCKYGGIIAKNLEEAQKPMLALIEQNSPNTSESNATQTMTSCGKIENYLKSSTYKKIGTCAAFGIGYELRLYR